MSDWRFYKDVDDTIKEIRRLGKRRDNGDAIRYSFDSMRYLLEKEQEGYEFFMIHKETGEKEKIILS